jgi:hypothetical protein
MRAGKDVFGVIAEFETPRGLLHGAEAVRKAGYTEVDAHTPFPVHGLDQVLSIPGSKVPWLVLGGALFGGIGGLALQWWTAAIDYPIKIAGKPYLSLPAFVPVTFELTVLFSALAAVLGMLALNGLPRLYHPTFKHSTIHRATDDRFFLVIEARDPLYSSGETRALLESVGGRNIEEVEA